MKKYGKFAFLVVLIVGTLIWIATSSMADTKTYYKTIAELGKMGSQSMEQHVRVGGDVQKGSIQHDGQIVDFTLVQADPAKPEQAPLYLKVSYNGRDPLPDTFRDGAQALADGRMGRTASSTPAKSRRNALPSTRPNRDKLPRSCSHPKPACNTDI